MPLVRLNTAAAGPGHDSADTEGALVLGRVDPRDVEKTVVNRGKGIDNHASVTVLTVVDHHEGRVDATALLVRFVIYLQLERILNEATRERLQVSRDGVRACAEAPLPGIGPAGNLSRHRERCVADHVAAEGKTLLTLWQRAL